MKHGIRQPSDFCEDVDSLLDMDVDEDMDKKWSDADTGHCSNCPLKISQTMKITNKQRPLKHQNY